jgi:6-pyruvoyltetrahydropterin/6-carboxytetrahydropterin synthase
MVRLGRLVRFSVTPFLDQDEPGSNSYASKPSGDGLALFLELAIELVGPAAPQTGLLVNVSNIDKVARRLAVPIFAEHIHQHFRRGEHISLAAVARILQLVHERLAGQFPGAQVDRLCLKLNPFRTLTMDAKEPGMIYLSEKFEFAATHRLWNDSFSERQNRDIFGKCANASGHGHNYVVEVAIAAPTPRPSPPARATSAESKSEPPAVSIGRFQSVVDSELIQLLDHRNLNVDVPAFRETTPTVENIALFAWGRLAGKFDPAKLHCVTVWESDRTYCTYYGPAEGETASPS